MKRLFTFSAALCALVVLAGVVPAEAATRARRPPASSFGMHLPRIDTEPYPSRAIGSVRLWDAGLSWRDIQPSPGPDGFVWGRLDAAVTTARRNGATVDYVLGQTPRWAALRPNQGGALLGPGAASPVADLASWRAYVRAVATRYKGRITTYEVWNEADITIFYQGSKKHMIDLARIAYRTIKSIDPRAVVTSPSIVARWGGDRRWMYDYAALGGLKWADVVNIHGYPLPDGTPESAMSLVDIVRTNLARQGIRLPIWNTEMNYGLAVGTVKGAPTPLTARQQSAYVVRTYLLSWTHKVRRVYWYDWSNTPFLGVRLQGSQPGSVSAPGRAFETVRSWMRGRVSPCTSARRLYSCTIRYADGTGVVRWYAGPGTVKAVRPRGTKAVYNLYDQRVPAPRRLGGAPVLYRLR